MTYEEFQRIQTRRKFLHNCVGGLGTAALAHLLALEGRTAVEDPTKINPLAPKAPPRAATAKNVIFLFMAGAPSQMDLYDPKPELKKWEGQALPPSMTKDLQLAFIKPSATILPSPRTFTPHGRAVSRFQTSCPTPVRSRMTSASSARCIARLLTTTRGNPC